MGVGNRSLTERVKNQEMALSMKKASSFTKGCSAKESGMALEFLKSTILQERGLFTLDSLLMATSMEKASK